MRRSLAAPVWALAYLAVVALPLLALLIGPVPPGLGFRWDLAVALGFAGLALMAAQFGLTARFRRAAAPFGIDVIYYFHRWIAVGALALLASHWAILRVTAAPALGPWQPWRAPFYMTAGRISLLLFVFLVGSSLLRKTLRLEYDRWRVLHIVAAVGALLLALVHINGGAYYTALPWKRALWIVYGAAWLALVLYIRVAKPWRLLRRPYRVTGVKPERGQAWTLTVEPVGHPGFAFSAGQFGWLTLGASPFRALEHPFSFSSSAADAGSIQFTIRELGDFTRTVGHTRPGATAYVDGPFGAFTTDRHPDAPGFAFVAGGVGIAPIMSMLRTLADHGDTRPLYLVYGNDCWNDVLFREEIDALRERLHLCVTHVLEDPPEGWTGDQGVVSREVLEHALPRRPEALEFFLCGPAPMTEAVQRELRGLGVPLSHIHSELFDMV
jgi:predicted ferric reductase